eukprot:scaffold237831_cov136-Cyclotella_meneghiniana.AAC.1
MECFGSKGLHGLGTELNKGKKTIWSPNDFYSDQSNCTAGRDFNIPPGIVVQTGKAAKPLCQS